MNNSLILLAGGVGSRANNNTPKQFVEVNGVPVFIFAIKPFLEYVDTIVVSCSKEYVDYAKNILNKHIKDKNVFVTEGGSTGLQSALNGFEKLKEVSSSNSLVFIHDSARPFLKEISIENCLNSLNNSNYIFSAVTMVESVYDSETKKVKKKDTLHRIMSPHVFKYDFLNSIFDDARKSNELTIFNYMVAKNYEINIAETEDTNFKITSHNELEFALKILK